MHVLNWAAPLLALPPIGAKIAGARTLVGGENAEFTQNQDGVILKVPPSKNDETDRVIVLTLAK